MLVTESGIVIETRLEQYAKVQLSIFEIELGIVTDVILLPPENDSRAILLTESGITISPIQVFPSTRVSLIITSGFFFCSFSSHGVFIKTPSPIFVLLGITIELRFVQFVKYSHLCFELNLVFLQK